MLEFFHIFKLKMDFASYIDCHNWTVFLLGFFGLFCKSELLNLKWSNISEVTGSIKILVTTSKTVKHAVYVHVATRSDNICPVHALKLLHDLLLPAMRKDILLVFCSTAKSASTPKALTGSTFANHIKKWIEFIELDPADYSGYLLRRGGASALL